MLLKGKDIIGKKVITVRDGKILHTIDDVVYDPEDQKVKAFIINKGGMFSDSKVILFEEIRKFGPDAILVEYENNVIKATDAPERITQIAKDNIYLTKTKIVTEEGKELGNVSDIYFDSDNGQVVELEVTQGVLGDLHSGKKRVKIEDIVTIGQDVTIVRAYTEEAFENQGQTQGFQGAWNHARTQMDDEKLRSSWETVKEDAGTLYDKAATFVQKMTVDAKDKLEKAKADPANQERYRTATNKFEQARGAVASQVSRVKTRREVSRKEDAVGRYLTKTILSPTDETIGDRGSMVTHAMINEAEKHGLVDQILNNTTSDPVV